MSETTLSSLPVMPLDLPPHTDGYAFHNSLRAQSPLATGPNNQIFVMRYKDFDLITSPKTRQVEAEDLEAQNITSGPLYEGNNNSVLFSNGEAHQRRRTPMAKTFAFRLMDGMRPRITALVSEIVTAHLGQGPIDFLDLVAGQLPARIIAEILGVPRDDLPTFLGFIPMAAESLGPLHPGRREPIEQNLIAFHAYIDGLIESRRDGPHQDFLSQLVAEAEPGGLTHAELRSQVLALILAGSDTTRGTLCMTLATLLNHPDQWRAFCADPDGLKRNVVQEGLRFEPVVEGVPRIAEEDIQIDGEVAPAGAVLLFCIVSALRDPDVYKDPDRFNIHRTDHPRWHPIFGAGAHRCLGEALARAELEESLAVIARLAPKTKIVGPHPKLSHLGLRQVDQMQVAFD